MTSYWYSFQPLLQQALPAPALNHPSARGMATLTQQLAQDLHSVEDRAYSLRQPVYVCRIASVTAGFQPSSAPSPAGSAPANHVWSLSFQHPAFPNGPPRSLAHPPWPPPLQLRHRHHSSPRRRYHYQSLPLAGSPALGRHIPAVSRGLPGQPYCLEPRPKGQQRMAALG
ncbi:hypothetical protein M758_UG216500 [Ceratodon purpureus]|nr:hypothetical protein M758_UG216500 [Ceratodon purpureus]